MQIPSRRASTRQGVAPLIARRAPDMDDVPLLVAGGAPEAGVMPSLPARRTLKVGGITPFTATDFPGHLAAVIFVQGCPWRCGYCHNPHLQPRTPDSPLAWEDVMALLRRRRGLVDAVVFSGGEPTMDPALEDAMREVRELGFRIGLHSGGTHPSRLRAVLPLVDWIGLDIKTDFAEYERVTRVRDSGKPAFESLEAVLESGVAHECRTTVHPALHDEASIEALARKLAGMGVTHYALQVFRSTGCDDDALNQAMLPDFPAPALAGTLVGLFPGFTLRKS